MAKTLSRIFKNGNSQAISLNKTVLNQAGLEIGDNLVVEIESGVVKLTKKEKSIKDEIQDFYRNGGRYEEEEIDFGTPVGEEEW
ncbi:AbrB/MazE/SpoVT family DNA-binding domain-containing protein [Staphylococcus cohnii]|uniref:AbrB/MazE/SpoVT family DNA-binding domain-containing protein n=1 Tax=Staphylococcus TaxID=1279 RepID=UPI00184B3AF5|nr:AbrB/MazE/SpoVT family DNA-binding domain-containing protein [Staphylococcus sp.]NWN86761.1 AbrB/MazE/SpoVT family DNA-binding domain-containing protein [Staphylococcus sp.]